MRHQLGNTLAVSTSRAWPARAGCLRVPSLTVIARPCGPPVARPHTSPVLSPWPSEAHGISYAVGALDAKGLAWTFNGRGSGACTVPTSKRS